MNPAYFEIRFRMSEHISSWPDEFVIISAYATTGQAWAASDNEVSDRRLASELNDLKDWVTRIVGYSPTSGHAEPSWAVALSLNDGRAIGEKYRQDAIYYIERDMLSVSRCGAPGEVVRMGSFRERLDPLMRR
jgi:hypothetical protein